MSDVKWIKIATDIFDDEKILLIEGLPQADSIIIVWFKLLCLAGKQNNSGVFIINESIAYTSGMLATVFRMKESTVKKALKTFEQFGMIEIVDGVITIPKWNKHQTLDSYEKKKERDRQYQQERRERQKTLAKKSSDNSFDVSFSTSDDFSSDVAVSEEEIDNRNELNEMNIYACAREVMSDSEINLLVVDFGDAVVQEVFEVFESINDIPSGQKIPIGSARISKDEVVAVYKKLTYENFYYVLDVLSRKEPEKISNRKAYIRTMLFNSLTDSDEYYAAKYEADRRSGRI